MNSSTTLFPKTRPPYETRASRRHSKITLSGEEESDEAKQGGLAGLNATLGLVIHAMADGIALGASSLSEKGGLGFVVFLAVIVHKGGSLLFDIRSIYNSADHNPHPGPTALGLTTTLLSQKLTRAQIRTRLLLFSASAPVGAILTYFLVKLFGGSDAHVGKHDIDGIQWWTGAVLLFSVSELWSLYTLTRFVLTTALFSPHISGRHIPLRGHRHLPPIRLGQPQYARPRPYTRPGRRKAQQGCPSQSPGRGDGAAPDPECRPWGS